MMILKAIGDACRNGFHADDDDGVDDDVDVDGNDDDNMPMGSDANVWKRVEVGDEG